MGIARIAGFPDGNGHGWNLRKVAVTGLVTAIAGWAGVGAAKAAWSQVQDAVFATAAIYRDVPQHGKDIQRIDAEVSVLRSKAPMPPDVIEGLAEMVRDHRAQKAKRNRGGS